MVEQNMSDEGDEQDEEEEGRAPLKRPRLALSEGESRRRECHSYNKARAYIITSTCMYAHVLILLWTLNIHNFFLVIIYRYSSFSQAFVEFCWL